MAKVVIDEERCKGCELCTIACPRRLLVIGSQLNSKGYRPVEFRPTSTAEQPQASYPFETRRRDEEVDNRCTGCCLCARMCPDVAITILK